MANRVEVDEPMAKIIGRRERISVILSGSEGTAPQHSRHARIAVTNCWLPFKTRQNPRHKGSQAFIIALTEFMGAIQ